MATPGENGSVAREAREWETLGATIIGGCCGTDIRHVTAIAEACMKVAA